MSSLRLRAIAALGLLASLVFGSGCAASAEDDSAQDEAAINRFFDGPVVRKLINLMNDVDSAEAANTEDKSRLAKELSTFGPALTVAQQSAYVVAYGHLDRVVNDQRQYVDATRALRDYLVSAEGGGALKAAAPRTSSAAEALYLGHKKLATTPYALPAAGFAAWTLDKRNHGNPLAVAVAKYDWVNDVLVPATTHGAGEAIAEADGDPEGAFTKLTEQLSVLQYATQDHAEVYTGWTALVTTVRTRDMKAFGKLEARLLKLPVVGAFMSVGVLYNLLAVAGDVQSGDVGQETFATVGDAAQQLTRAMVSVSQAGLLGRFGGGAASTFTKFVQRITPGLGVLCTTASLRGHIEKMGSDGAIGAYIGALGDVVALAGVLVESFGVTAPLGAIITGLGFTLSFLGDIVQDWLAGNAIVDEERRLLRSAGVSDDVANVLVAVNAKHLQAWASDLHYDAPKLQWLAVHAPNALTAGWLQGLDVKGFGHLVGDFGYASDGGFGLLQSMSDDSYDFVRDVSGWSFSGTDLRGQWLRAIDAQTPVGAADHVRAFTKAAAYLRAH